MIDGMVVCVMIELGPCLPFVIFRSPCIGWERPWPVVLLWLIRHESLFTNLVKVIGHISHDASCPVCGFQVEC